MLNVLVACEESQAVCKAFRVLGHRAFSCDLQECSGGHPEWHIQGDALAVINGNCTFVTADGCWHSQVGKWDLLIAHPPCTFISNAGARFLYPKGVLNEERLRKGIEATHFFMAFYYADCDHIAVENPVPSSVYMLPPYTQAIQPYHFGVPLKKKTCLWLKGLPSLCPTNLLDQEDCQSTKIPGNWFNHGGKERQKNRAKTFPEVAEAMAVQWSEYLEKKETYDVVADYMQYKLFE